MPHKSETKAAAPAERRRPSDGELRQAIEIAASQITAGLASLVMIAKALGAADGEQQPEQSETANDGAK